MFLRLSKGTLGYSRQIQLQLGMSRLMQLQELGSDATCPWGISMRKIKDIDAFLSQILMIKEFRDLIGQQCSDLQNFHLKLVKENSLRYEACTGKQRCFILYFRQKVAGPYSERISYQLTGMGTQKSVPKKQNVKLLKLTCLFLKRKINETSKDFSINYSYNSKCGKTIFSFSSSFD